MSKQQLFINRTGYVMARGAERTPGAYVNRGDGLPPGYVSYDQPAQAPAGNVSEPADADRWHPVVHTIYDPEPLAELAAALGGWRELGNALQVAVVQHRSAELVDNAGLPPGYKAYTSAP